MADEKRSRAFKRDAPAQEQPAPSAATTNEPTNDTEASFEGGPLDGQNVNLTVGPDADSDLRMIDGDRYATYSKSGDGYKFNGYEDEDGNAVEER